MRRGGKKELSKREKNKALIDVRMYPEQFTTLSLHSNNEIEQQQLHLTKIK